MGETTTGAATLRVPTIAVPVELALHGRGAEHAELFVAARQRTGRGELVADVAALLEAEAPFVPVRERAELGSPVALLGKAAITWVAITLGGRAGSRGGGRAASNADGIPDAEIDAEPSEVIHLYDQKHLICVELTSGSNLDGHILYSSPADHPRVLDHLNQPGRFFRVWTAGALYLINKHHVVRVIER